MNLHSLSLSFSFYVRVYGWYCVSSVCQGGCENRTKRCSPTMTTKKDESLSFRKKRNGRESREERKITACSSFLF